jgi:hypothetical protein
MPDRDQTFVHRNQRGFIVVYDDVEYGSAYGDERSGRMDAVVIRLAAEFLDMNFNPADENVEEIRPIGRIVSKDYAGVGVDLESTAVGNLKTGKSVGPGGDFLFELYNVSRMESPGIIVLKNRDLPGHADDFGGAGGCNLGGGLSQTHSRQGCE